MILSILIIKLPATTATNSVIAKTCQNPYSRAYEGNKVFSVHIPAKPAAINRQIANGIKYITFIFNPIFCIVVVNSS